MGHLKERQAGSQPQGADWFNNALVTQVSANMVSKVPCQQHEGAENINICEVFASGESVRKERCCRSHFSHTIWKWHKAWMKANGTAHQTRTPMQINGTYTVQCEESRKK